ncbi:MCP four helix bundle domain-containing protein, partial [Massilia pseudoviolaceinigra]|uniref:MCP four helix bundle domain-containing protein n=2 Tax=Telluria group TaxID=2895353 RepID=UPI00279668C6
MSTQLSVRARLLTGFMLVAILGAVVAAIGIYNMAKMNSQAERAYSDDLLGISYTKEATINLLYAARAMRNQILARTPEESSKFSAFNDAARKTLGEKIALARPLFRAEAAKALFRDLDAGIVQYDAARAHLSKLLADTSPEGKAAAIDFALGPLVKQATLVDESLQNIAQLKEKVAKASAEESG